MMSKDSEFCAEGISEIKVDKKKLLCYDCLLDDLKVDAFGFCTDCSHSLCEECCRTHRKSSATRAHNIKEYTEENTSPDQSVERNDEAMSTDGKDGNTPVMEQIKSQPAASEESQTTLYCDPCLFDNENIEATAFCTNCVEYLCQECCRDHKKSKSTRDHNVLKENMPKNATVYKTIKEMTSCSDHPDAEVTHRCNNHKVYVCVMCIAGSHRKCTSVTELVMSESLASSRLDTVEQQLQDVRNNAMKVKEKRQENIESLLTEKGQIQDTMLNVIDEVIEKMEQLKEKEICSLNSLAESELSKMTDDIGICNGFESDMDNYTELLKTVKELGDDKGADIIAEVIVGRVSDIDKALAKLGKKANVHMGFKQNPILSQIRSVGKTSVIQDARMKGETKANESSLVSASNDDSPLVPSSNDASPLVPSSSNASPFVPSIRDDFGKYYSNYRKGYASSLASMLQHASDDNKKSEDWDATQDIQTVDAKQYRQLQCDKNPCCIIGGFVLKGGYILVVDESNMNLKLYTKNYKTISSRQLEARPVDMCRTGASTFAVIYKDSKEIECFEVELGKPFGGHVGRRGFSQSTIKLDRSFKTKNENYRITMYDDRFVLLSKTSSGSVVLEVRQKDNNMLVLSEEFNSNESHGFDQTGLALCTTSRGIIVCHKNVGMSCFSCNFTTKGLTVKWRINPKITNIQRVISDLNDNLYVCSTKAGSVYKISTSTNSMKVITSNLNNPVCLIGNYKMNELLVGCENDDNMYIFEM